MVYRGEKERDRVEGERGGDRCGERKRESVRNRRREIKGRRWGEKEGAS